MKNSGAKDQKPVARNSGGKINRRNQIVAATEELLRTRGLSGVTTKHIAASVGCSEAAIYVHFKSRLDLLLSVLDESLPDMLEPFQTLNDSLGKRTPEENLESAVKGMLSFQQRVIPMVAGLFSEPEVLAGYRQALAKNKKGPHRVVATLTAYLESEQKLGRVDENIDSAMVAHLLISVVFFRSFAEEFSGRLITPSNASHIKQVVGCIGPATPADKVLVRCPDDRDSR